MFFSKTEEEHLLHLCFVFECFREHHLKLKSTKLELFKSKINYVAHHASKDGICPSRENLKAVAGFAPPLHQNYSPFRLSGTLQTIYKGFAYIAQALHEHPLSVQASPHSSWALVWVSSCNCLKARLKLSASLVCRLASLLELEKTMRTDDSGKGGQMMLLFWALPQCLHEDGVNF